MTQLARKTYSPYPYCLPPPLSLDPVDSAWAKPPCQMWPSQVWWSLPGLTQQGPAGAIVQDLAAQQVAGRSRIAGSFDEKPVRPSLRG